MDAVWLSDQADQARIYLSSFFVVTFRQTTGNAGRRDLLQPMFIQEEGGPSQCSSSLNSKGGKKVNFIQAAQVKSLIVWAEMKTKWVCTATQGDAIYKFTVISVGFVKIQSKCADLQLWLLLFFFVLFVFKTHPFYFGVPQRSIIDYSLHLYKTLFFLKKKMQSFCKANIKNVRNSLTASCLSQ